MGATTSCWQEAQPVRTAEQDVGLGGTGSQGYLVIREDLGQRLAHHVDIHAKVLGEPSAHGLQGGNPGFIRPDDKNRNLDIGHVGGGRFLGRLDRIRFGRLGLCRRGNDGAACAGGQNEQHHCHENGQQATNVEAMGHGS